MAKASKPGKPAKPVIKTLPRQYQASPMVNHSDDYTGVGPRVGSGKKKGTVTVAKPSRVQSGTAKRKK